MSLPAHSGWWLAAALLSAFTFAPLDTTLAAERWGEWITCAKGTTECQTSRTLIACNLDKAVQIAEQPAARGRAATFLKDCSEVLSPDRTFEVEPTKNERVIYAKSGTEHIGYVPMDHPVASLGGGEFPQALHGVWLSSEANCRQYLRDPSSYDRDDFFEIAATELRAYESNARVMTVRGIGPGGWSLELHFDSPGGESLGPLTFWRSGDTLRTPESTWNAERVLCTADWPKRSVARTPRYGDFPARPYRGPIAMPDFRGRDRDHRTFRTRIAEGMRGGPNFAGHLVIIPIGCGTACQFFPVGDALTGRVMSFPLGGEEYQYLGLDHRVDSDLVIARWERREGDEERCLQSSYLWTGSGFRQLSRPEVIATDRCPVQ